jgi:molybdopterin-guanine dinucleotide biosynthesis protein A
LNETLEIEGFVLTGGASSRMGTDKSRLVIDGETLAGRAVRNLSAVCCNVSTVGGDRLGDVPCIEDSKELRIPQQKAAIIGVHAALTHSKTEWTAILACDLPFVTPELFGGLISKARSAPPGINVVVPRQPDGRLQPLCGLYRTKPTIPVVETAIRDGELSITKLALKLKLISVDLGELIGLEGANDLLFNINTPDDLNYLRDRNDTAN